MTSRVILPNLGGSLCTAAEGEEHARGDRHLGAILALSIMAGTLLFTPCATSRAADRVHQLRAASAGSEVDELLPIPQDEHTVAELFALMSLCDSVLSDPERWRIASAIHHESKRYGYDALFVLAMVDVESGCSPTARGKGGTVGLVQLKPSIARAMAIEARLPWQGAQTLVTPVVNIRLGLHYLAQLEQRFRDPLIAMAAYNMGPARVARMPRQRARAARYVRTILARYEELLAGMVAERI